MNIKLINLLDESAFATGGGLWTGKKGPFVSATVIRNTNFTASGRVDYSDVAVLEVEEKQLASRRLLPGDIVIERSGGGPSQPVGRVVFFDRVDGVFSHSNFTSRLRVLDTDKLEPRFVFYFLLYFHDSGQTDHLQRRTTGIRNLDWRAYRESAAVPLFDRDEQRQIAAVLSAVQRAIERQERLIALTAELKKALMHKLFTEGTRGEPLKQTEIGLVPESWKIAKLADVVEYIDYGVSQPIPKTPPPGSVKIVSTAEITKNGEILYSKIRRLTAPARTVQRLTLRDGDVLFNWRNSSELIGKTAVFEEQAEPHVFASFVLRIRCDEVRTHNVFLSYLMNYYRDEGVFVKLSRRAVNQSNYNRNEISVLAIPHPSIEEQLEISRAITAVVNVRNFHERKRDALQALFRTLLHQLMTAQVRVGDLDLSALEEAEQPAGAAW